MSGLSLSLLGSFVASLDERPLRKFRTNRVQALLIYLAAESALGTSLHRRERLMDLLWPGLPQKSAQVNLRQTLYHLRKAVPEMPASDDADPIPFLLTDRQTVQINPAYPVKLDVADFIRLLDGPQDQWPQAIDLYRGDFLADFYLADAETFEAWAAARRAVYQRQALDALTSLTALKTEQGTLDEAETYARRQLEIDNLRERAHRQLMIALARNGQRSEALAQYEQCRHLLQAELGVEPSPETTDLYERIRAGETFVGVPGRGERSIRGYELLERIGQGGFGVVFRARQTQVGREVAIKAILPQYANHPEFIRRFETEAQLVARLEHPHIVPLYDYWREPDGAYLVMRWLRGGSLGAALERGPWKVEAAVRLVDQIAAALATAHRQGVVHRDIKPANILLDEEGNAYLSDLGIAKDVESAVELTQTDVVAGSSAYISPEQVRSEPVTPLTDIYGLGVVLYELLTGAHPFPDESSAALSVRHLSEPLPPVLALRPELPQAVDEVIQRATAKDPAGRFPDVLSLADAFRQALTAEAVVSLSLVGTPLPEPANPYKGLRPFLEADAADFFGREALTEQLVTRLASTSSPALPLPGGGSEGGGRFLAVVGPSGSGKSSVVRAGLLPALRRSALPGSGGWFIIQMLPGAHPLEELEAALLHIAVNPPESLLNQMRQDERGLLRAVIRCLPADDGHQGRSELVLVIDQFEELFTLVQDEAERVQFLEALLAAVSDPRGRLRVVVTLRADFYDRPLQYAGFGELVRQRTEVVLPLSSAELERAIAGPAQRVGAALEPGLLAEIVADVSDQPGALPLLQYALTELFERREGNTLTQEAYHVIGGVLGALGRRAEELYAGLDPDGREATRQLFLRLVTLGEGVEDTRRRVLRAELEALTKDERQRKNALGEVGDSSFVVGPSSVMDEVIEVYGRSRLLTFDHDPVTRGPTVEVAHEALLRGWTRLREWLETSRADVRMQRILADAAAEWKQADHDSSFLLHGSRLDQFEGWTAGTELSLTQHERAFLDASLAARDARRADEAARLAHETQLERRAFNRLRALVAVLLVAVLIAGGLTLFAFSQSRDARRQAVESHSLALAAAAERALGENEPVLALALALEANRIDSPPLPAQSTLYKVAYGRDRNHLEGDLDAIRSVAFSPDGRAALYGGTVRADSGSATIPNDTSLILSDIAIREAIWRREAPDGVESVAFSPDGQTALSGLRDGTLILWDMATGQQLRRFGKHAGSVSSVAFSPDGRTALSGSFDRKLILWDVETGREIHRFEGHRAPVWTVAVSPDGRLALSGATDKTLLLWDIETGEEIRRVEGYDAGVRSVAFSPDGRTALVGIGSIAEVSQDLVLLDVQLGEGIRRFEGHTAAVLSVAFSPDGRMALSGSNDSTIILWEIKTGEQIRRLEGHTAPVMSVAFSPDGRLALSGSDDGTVRLWHLSLDALIEWIEANLHVREFTCDEREQYRIEPLCGK